MIIKYVKAIGYEMKKYYFCGDGKDKEDNIVVFVGADMLCDSVSVPSS